MLKILVFVGTRPEAIKLAPLVKELKSRKKVFQVTVCFSGQHKEMLFEASRCFNFRPDYNLNIIDENPNSLSESLATIVKGTDSVIQQIKPNLVIVQGDTLTTLGAAMSSFFNKVQIAHIEAGLRSYDNYAPFPEEANRTIVSRLSNFHFCPTEHNANCLMKENLDVGIYVTGNTVVDALNFVINRIETESEFATQILEELEIAGYPLNNNFPSSSFHPEERRACDLQGQKKYLLVTLHRREIIDSQINETLEALATIAVNNPDIDIVLPLHKNPKVREIIVAKLKTFESIFLIDSLSYQSFIYLMSNCYFVLTDSGGIQEEVPSLNKPVIILREITERNEILAYESSQLVGYDKERIIDSAQRLLNDTEYYQNLIYTTNPFGDGNACNSIANTLEQIAGQLI